MLHLQSLTKEFPGGVIALCDVTLAVREREIVSVVGPSGCGKSTLLRIAAGLDKDFGGSVALPGGSQSPSVGLIFQEPRLMPWLSVADNITFGLRCSRREKRAVAARWLRAVGLEGFGNVLPKALSGGMAQRVAIARALAPKPSILLLDEPFSAVDALTKMQLQDLLMDIWQDVGTTMVLVTHDVDEAVYLSDRVVVLSRRPGRIATTIDVGAARPRDRGDDYLAHLRADILAQLGLHRETAAAA